MDERLANRLFEEGAFFFLLDVPTGTEVGIDFNCWRTAEKFKGIKMIPPGVHYIYYSAVDKQGCVAPRTGFFYNFSKRDVVVRKWNPETEDVINKCTGEETEVLKDNLKNLDKYLGAYPLDMWKKWVSLSSKIVSDVIGKIESEPQTITANAELVQGALVQTGSLPQNVKKRKYDTEDQFLAPCQGSPGTTLNFSKIPQNSFPKGSRAEDITKYSMDTSFILEQMLSSCKSPFELLAELQMVFLYFVIGQVYSAFEHWKQLIHVFCSADEMVLKNPSLIMEFIGDLYFQMQEVPTDFFVDIISSENFLVQTLRILFVNVLENTAADPQLKRRTSQLKKFVTRRFQWDFDAAPDDEAPIIVENIEDVL